MPGEAVGELAEDFLCNAPSKVRRRSEFKYASHDVFKPNDMDYFCDIATRLVKRNVHGQAFISKLQISSCRQRTSWLMEKKEMRNNGEGDQVEITKEEVLVVD